MLANSSGGSSVLIERIKKGIEQSSVVIADCSGSNPNVFYELGIAHTLGKKTILISSDRIEDAPSDVRHLYFIRYTFDNVSAFVDELLHALNVVLEEFYYEYYNIAVKIAMRFEGETGIHLPRRDEPSFIALLKTFEEISAKPLQPNPSMNPAIAEIVMPRLLEIPSTYLQNVTEWILNL